MYGIRIEKKSRFLPSWIIYLAAIALLIYTGREIYLSFTVLELKDLKEIKASKIVISEDQDYLVATGYKQLSDPVEGVPLTLEQANEYIAFNESLYKQMRSTAQREAKEMAIGNLAEGVWSIIAELVQPSSGYRPGKLKDISEQYSQSGDYPEDLKERVVKLLDSARIIASSYHKTGICYVMIEIRLNGREGLARILGYNQIVFSRDTWYELAVSFLRQKFDI